MRIGQSTDLHPLQEGRKLILGGVEIPFAKGTMGHSDGDALTHAVTEAVYGALGMGDLGAHYPDTDPQYEGICSLELLKDAAQKMKAAGYAVGNIDSLVILEEPKLRPYVERMRRNLAEAAGCDWSRVNVKATTAERLGVAGRGEAVIAQAVVLLEETHGRTE